MVLLAVEVDAVEELCKFKADDESKLPSPRLESRASESVELCASEEDCWSDDESAEVVCWLDKLVVRSSSDRLSSDEEDWSRVVVVSIVDDDEAIEDVKLVVEAVTPENDRLTSLGKYILGLATGSALASVEAATSAVTRIDFVCILQIL